METLWFVRVEAEIEKKAGKKARVKTSAAVGIGLITVALVGLAVTLYAMKQPEPGRLVIDLAIAFLSWTTGRTIGEKAGVEKG